MLVQNLTTSYTHDSLNKPISRISRDSETFSEEILDLGGNFGIQEEILTDLERINS